ncbi:MAG: hypothetical protein LBQ13_02885 [Endomicrobium sp.]|jgi:hypothetical protein|nr:hypothetical protein [Endomicrobium sp.]
MKLGKGITVFATEEAKRKWEGKELPHKKKKSSCPTCEIKLTEEQPENKDYINKENKIE